MDFKVFLSEEALSDLERVVAYITPYNPDAAGRIVPEFRRPNLREIIFRSYRIIYRVNQADKSVEIIRFWHAARGFPHVPGINF